MKNYFDGFYEIIHKNSVKRRRMVSLLLVLSIFVSSGVLWGLRDTVITMVNEPSCGFEEHEHTDECYEKILVCGLEESEEHAHTDECYEKVLKCGYDEHLHTTLCYTDVDVEADESKNGIYDDSMFEISNVPEDYDSETDTESDEEAADLDIPALMLDNGIEMFDAESQNSPYINPGTISTIDNIAEGIKFTLFDYGDSTLEGAANNYEFAGTWGENGFIPDYPYSHDNVKDTGINTGRNINDDIMFFAYGTPIPRNIPESGDYVFYNYKDGDVQHYNPDKNSYSGDYNSNPQYTGNRPVTGIVRSVLGDDGYPVMNNAKGNSLDYLFAPSTNVGGVDQSDYKTVYTGVNHLLRKEGNHLTYNSDKNYAYFDKNTRDFTVYDKTYPVINENHHKAGDYDSVKEVTYDQSNGGEFKIGFFPFDEYDPNRRDPNYDGNKYNHHFGMTMEAKFTNIMDKSTNEPIVFKYSGDDDMWVFVDGVLVLDIGGIHEPAAGMIDFTNGLVWTQDNALGKTAEVAYNELRDSNTNLPIFSDNLVPDNGVNTDGKDKSLWKVETIASKYDGNVSCSADDGKEHTIKMFYLERGGCYSNLAMEMNLPTLKPLTVTKNVDYGSHLIKGIYEDYEYIFQVYEKVINSTTNEEEWIIPEGINNRFKLKAGERKTIENLDQNRVFKVVEVGYDPPGSDTPEVILDPDVFSEVKVNGESIPIIGGQAEKEGGKLKDFNSYYFNNKIKEDFTDVRIKKKWDPPLQENSSNSSLLNSTVKYRILRTDSKTGEVKQIALLENETDPVSGKNIQVKRRTFSISRNEWESGAVKTGLLSQYGDHYYTYSVEELDIPTGFKASYSTDNSGALVITNTDMSKTDIYVKKQWEHPKENDLKVKLKLTRSVVGYTASAPTTLKVNILDEGGNEYVSYSTDQVYVGGSAELAYKLPEGVVLYNGDANYPQKKFNDGTNDVTMPISQQNSINDKLYVNFDEENNILIVQNLAEGTNEVTFKVTSFNAEDSILLLHHSFTRGTNGWKTNTDSAYILDSEGQKKEKLISSNFESYAKRDAMLVRGREKSWQGAKLVLDPTIFKPKTTYSFSTYVYYNEDGAPDTIPFKFTFNDGLEKPNYSSYQTISEMDVKKGEWTHLTGTIEIPEQIDPYNMYIIVETVDPDKEEKPLTSQFRMDEFTAIEGTTPVNVSKQQKQGTEITDIGGVVTIGGASRNTIYDFQFKNGNEGWSVQDFSGEHNTKIESGNNFDGIEVSGRDAHNDGISIKVPDLVPGKKYHFKGLVQEANKSSAQSVKLTFATGNNSYPPIKTISLNDKASDDFEWHEFELDYTIPSNSNQNTMYIYFETPQPENGQAADLGNFRVHYLTISEETEVDLPTKDGYDIVNGQYVSNYSEYGVSLDTNSVTKPLKLNDEGYKPDTNFLKVVTLDSDSSWSYHWQNRDIGTNYIYEDNTQNLYKYHIEEVAIVKSDGTEIPISVNELTHDLMSDDGKYLVTYSGNDVANNDESSPMLITNEYIWYKLPATGGSGTGRIYFLGCMFTAIGIISGSVFYRRKRRRV